MDIENDVIPFYRKIVEEFKKIPEVCGIDLENTKD